MTSPASFANSTYPGVRASVPVQVMSDELDILAPAEAVARALAAARAAVPGWNR